MEKRIESDSIGSMEIPQDAYYGVQTLRAVENFQITGHRIHSVFIKNLVLVKKAAAITNMKTNSISKETGNAIIQACDEILSGKFSDQFVVDAIQGGAGTSSNMNVNEVIANRATEILGGKKGEYIVHPNDHVNKEQSTNDVVPTAGKLSVMDLLKNLIKEIELLQIALRKKEKEFHNIIKMGRTQLQDAVPMRLGQSFGGYAAMLNKDLYRLKEAYKEMIWVNLGGTAIGTGINTSREYFENIVPELCKVTGYSELNQADNLFDSTENLDGFVAVSGAIKTCAMNLSKMCSDLRLLSSGPRTGIGEINLPPRQNGSSIMPGKINPVIPEVVNQVAFLIVGHDATIAMAAEAGQLELNAFEPVLFYTLFESITSLTGAVNTLTRNCIEGITANKENCTAHLEQSIGIVTALCPIIGYQKSAEIAKKALKTGKTIRQLVLEEKILSEQECDKILDPKSMTGYIR